MFNIALRVLFGFVSDVEASTGESETERWARERRERRQARARRKAQRTGEVNTTNSPHLENRYSTGCKQSEGKTG